MEFSLTFTSDLEIWFKVFAHPVSNKHSIGVVHVKDMRRKMESEKEFYTKVYCNFDL